MARFWQGVAAVFAVATVVLFVWGNRWKKLYFARPVLPAAPLVTKPDTTANRPDAVKWVPPETKAKLDALQARVEAFMADSTRGLDSCIALLSAADTLIDSLREELAHPPEVILTLTDTSLPYLWPTVHYQGVGTLGISQWSYRFFKDKWPREKRPPGRGIGRVGSGIGIQIATHQVKVEGMFRVKQNTLVKLEKVFEQKGLWVSVSYFFL